MSNPTTTGDPFKCEKCGAALGWCEPVLCDKCQPKPRTGEQEWTEDWLDKLISGMFASQAIKVICERHNAALALKGEALCANRTYTKHVEDNLAAAQAAIESEPELPDDMPAQMWAAIKNDRDAATEMCRIIVRLTKDGIRKAAGDTTALDAAIDAARQPLVDAARKLVDLLSHDYWAQCPIDVAKAADEVIQLLAKEKEGK